MYWFYYLVDCQTDKQTERIIIRGLVRGASSLLFL